MDLQVVTSSSLERIAASPSRSESAEALRAGQIEGRHVGSCRSEDALEWDSRRYGVPKSSELESSSNIPGDNASTAGFRPLHAQSTPTGDWNYLGLSMTSCTTFSPTLFSARRSAQRSVLHQLSSPQRCSQRHLGTPRGHGRKGGSGKMR